MLEMHNSLLEGYVEFLTAHVDENTWLTVFVNVVQIVTLANVNLP